MEQNLKKVFYKRGISGFHFIKDSVDKKSHRRFRHKGLTMIELIVALGVMSILSGIGYISYLKYFQVGKLTALHQVGVHVLSRMQICVEESVLNTGTENLLPSGNWRGCNSKARLNLADCDGCEEPLTVNGSICMTMKKDKFSQCVGYNPTGTISHRFRITVNEKVCVHRNLTVTSCTADSDCGVGENCVTVNGSSVCEKPSGHSAVWPYMNCNSDADCDSGFKCFQGQGQCRQVNSTTVDCS